MPSPKSVRLRFGKYEVDVTVLLAWVAAVPLGGLLAYCVILALGSICSMVGPHIPLGLNPWVTAAVRFLLPAAIVMAVVVICTLIPRFPSRPPRGPVDFEGNAHAVIPQGIANGAWLLVYSSAWGAVAILGQGSGFRLVALFWLSVLV